MRVPETTIIALYGNSAAGKTTLAVKLAAILDIPLRSCGSEIMRTAREKNLGQIDLANDDHFRIDAETVAWAATKNLCIVDGRFLDVVLSPLRDRLVLIRIIATELKRAERLTSMGKTSAIPAELDNRDQQFRRSLYGGLTCSEPDLIIDTSTEPVQTCAEQIMAFLKTCLRGHF